ncbi:MAG TPA: DsbA family oxidoreductase [Arenibacter sp.]|nr:DsbA family oxidoreductase [Arenibacter sp.]
MEISIWSDIRCPFCYIGKRKFEAALDKFAHKDKVSIVWKSFELDPNLQTLPDVSTLAHFCDTKGVSEEQALQMFGHAVAMGKEVGIDFNFENAVVANSLNAHRLIKFAAVKGLSGKMKEALLQAHFIAGNNIDDIDFLVGLAALNGMDKEAVRNMLLSDDYTYEVRQDEMEARNLGINGVPFFVLDEKHGISGAQATETFLEALEQIWGNKIAENAHPSGSGDACAIDGEC